MLTKRSHLTVYFVVIFEYYLICGKKNLALN